MWFFFDAWLHINYLWTNVSFQLYMPCYTYQYTTITMLKFPYTIFEYFFHDVFVQRLVTALMKCKSHVWFLNVHHILNSHCYKYFAGQSIRCYNIGRHSYFPWSSHSRADEHEDICRYRLFSFPAIN